MSENLYARRDPEAQGEHYLKHLDAMTREKLFDKCAIAAELAHRDMEIEWLRAALQEILSLDPDGGRPRSIVDDMRRVAAQTLAEPQPLPARDQEHDGHDGHL